MCQRPRAAHRRLDQRWFQPFDHPGGERLPAGRWLSLRQLADRQFTAIPTRLGLLGFRDLTAGGGRLHPRADHHVVLHGGAAVCGYGHPWSALCPFVRGAGIYLRVHPDDWHHRDWLRGSGDCLNGELATGPDHADLYDHRRLHRGICALATHYGQSSGDPAGGVTAGDDCRVGVVWHLGCDSGSADDGSDPGAGGCLLAVLSKDACPGVSPPTIGTGGQPARGRCTVGGHGTCCGWAFAVKRTRAKASPYYSLLDGLTYLFVRRISIDLSNEDMQEAE